MLFLRFTWPCFIYQKTLCLCTYNTFVKRHNNKVKREKNHLFMWLLDTDEYIWTCAQVKWVCLFQSTSLLSAAPSGCVMIRRTVCLGPEFTDKNVLWPSTGIQTLQHLSHRVVLWLMLIQLQHTAHLCSLTTLISEQQILGWLLCVPITFTL